MRAICCLFLITCFFPFIRVLPLNMDAQPNSLILGSIIILLLGKHKINKYIGDLLLIVVFSFIIMLLSSPTPNGIRIFSNYLSLFVISYSTYLVLTYLRGIPYNLFRFSVYVWACVGLIQTLISPTFLSFLTLRGADGGPSFGRGVSSLAVEPTFYGMICVFLLLINYVNFNSCKQYKFICSICLGQLLLLSRSTTCILALMIALMFYGVYKLFESRHLWRVLCISVILIIIGVQFSEIYVSHSNSRLANILGAIISNPEAFLSIDYSVNHRFTHAFMTIRGFFVDFGLPHGFDGFSTYLTDVLKSSYWRDVIMVDPKGETRITTSLGGILFELGVFAVPLFIVIIGCLKTLKSNGFDAVLIGMILLSMMLNAMNFNQAILPFFIGNLIYIKYHPNRKDHSLLQKKTSFPLHE